MAIQICPQCGYQYQNDSDIELSSCIKCGYVYAAPSPVQSKHDKTLQRIEALHQVWSQIKNLKRVGAYVFFVIMLVASYHLSNSIDLIDYFPGLLPTHEQPGAGNASSVTPVSPGVPQASSSASDNASVAVSAIQDNATQGVPLENGISTDSVAVNDANISDGKKNSTAVVHEFVAQKKAPVTVTDVKDAISETPSVANQKKNASGKKTDTTNATNRLIDEERQKEKEALEKKKITKDDGVLTITSQRDTVVVFVVPVTKERIGPYTIKKGKTLDVRLKKRAYVVEIVQNGEKSYTSMNFIGNTGSLDL